MNLNKLPDEVNLLYIEDDEDIVKIISEQLNSTPHTKFNIVVKTTLKEGLIYLEKDYPIDAILLDLVLPNSRGIGTFKKVKEKAKDIPIVIVSAHEDIACKCVGLGAQDYLVKPDIPAGLLIRSLKYSIQRNTLEKKIKNVIMTSTLGYHMYQLKRGELIFVGYNPAANKILGVDNKQYIGKSIKEAFPGASPEIEQPYRRALKGVPWENERVEYSDQQINKATFRVNAYRTDKNLLTVTFEDITKKIKTEETLNDTLQEYKNLVEVTGASIFGMDFINRKFTYVNDIMCETLGYSREELLRMWPSDYLTPESKKEFEDRLRALKNGEYVHKNVEYECIRKDGKHVWVLVSTNYPDVNQPIVIANAVAIDITEKRMAEKALEKKELEVFSNLEERIHKWKDELIVQSTEKENKLQLIDAEILKLGVSDTEVI